MTSILRAFESYTTTGLPTVGDTKTSITTADHNGWLLCDGRLFPKSNYPFLFNAIGYTFGGSGNMFRLPDGRGRVVGHVNSSNVTLDMNGNPIPMHAFGTATGEDTHTLSIAEMPTHNHPGSSNMNAGTGISLTNNTIFQSANNNSDVQDNTIGSTNVNSGGANVTVGLTDPTHTHTLVLSNQGLSNAHNNIQPTIYMGNMFVYSGLYASTGVVIAPYIYY